VTPETPDAEQSDRDRDLRAFCERPQLGLGRPIMMPWPARMTGRSAALIKTSGSPPDNGNQGVPDGSEGVASDSASQSNSHVAA
jgi:hypothetical protein